MKIVQNANIFLMGLGIVLWGSTVVSVHAEGMNAKITEPSNKSISLKDGRINGHSSGIKAFPAEGNISADLVIRSHCKEDFEVIKTHIHSALDSHINITSDSLDPWNRANRTEFSRPSNFKLETIAALGRRCNEEFGEKEGSLIANIPISVEVTCSESWDTMNDGYGLDEVKKQTYNLKLPLSVQCLSNAQEINATVDEQYWIYECPETDKRDPEYWQKYRLVVEGTGARYVKTSKNLGTPRCIRAHKSNMSNSNDILFQIE